MTNAPETLNTEENDIAGNRINGPIGNTTTQHTAPGTGTGQPGGPPAPAEAPVTSKELAEAETSPGKGAVGPEIPPQENKEADPAEVVPEGSYGGNFGNSTQDSYRDADRRENQDSSPDRGEFGAQDAGGTTHGGFGNQNRQADYEPNNTAEDKYYGGPGAAGEQTNSYHAYDGRDERPDGRTQYGFETGTPPTQLADTPAAHANDNGSVKGPSSGYAADYGHTSLPTAQVRRPVAAPETDHRNQDDDYIPVQSGTDKQGRHAPADSDRHAPAMADQAGPLPASSQGYGDRGRDQPNAAPDMATGDARNGYHNVPDNEGSVEKGIGSKGGSYNDQYDNSQPGSRAASPARGDERLEDRDANYGEKARQQNRASSEENAADHGAPQRNAGREGQADE